MKKMLCLVTLLCLMAFPALAQQVSDTLAPAYSDSSAQMLSQEMERRAAKNNLLAAQKQ